jgi:hypothetical protein
MSESEVVTLMKSSKSKNEWNSNCSKVKISCGGDYPGFWYGSIIMSGLLTKVAQTW